MRRFFAVALTAVGLWAARDYLVALAWAVLIAIATWPLYCRFAALMPGWRTLGPAVWHSWLPPPCSCWPVPVWF